MHIVFTTAAAVVAETPHAVCSALFGGSVTASVLCAVLAGVFAFCAQTICYAVLLRGIKTRFTPDELIAGGLSAVAFAFAAAGVEVQGFNLAFGLTPFFVMLFAFGVSPLSAFAFAVVAGAGVSLNFLSLDFVAFAVLAAAAACALSPFTKWASAAGVTAVYAVLWLALDFDGSNWQNLVSVALGAGVFLLLPKKWITGLCGGKRESPQSEA